LWNIGIVAAVLLLMKYRKFDGQMAAMYLLLYGIGRFWIEGLRMDSLMVWGTDVAVSQALSGVVALAAGGFIAVKLVLYYRNKKKAA
jgi:phosphatidylglycerol:prolipoprotein diacylglycerol transferase